MVTSGAATEANRRLASTARSALTFARRRITLASRARVARSSSLCSESVMIVLEGTRPQSCMSNSARVRAPSTAGNLSPRRALFKHP